MLNFLERERINSILLLRRLALLRGNKFSLNCGGESKVGLKKVLHLLLLVIYVRWHQTTRMILFIEILSFLIQHMLIQKNP